VSIYWNRKAESPEHVHTRPVSFQCDIFWFSDQLKFNMIELDRDLCSMVNQGILPLYFPRAGYCSLGRTFLEQDCPFRSSWC
jgi:hypothetical protein